MSGSAERSLPFEEGHRSVEESPEAKSLEPSLDQLSFGAVQQTLEEVAPSPTQLPLLPDPPPWEYEPKPSLQSRNGRLARKRTKAGITPGQQALF